jgi:hypothetical protein
LEKNKQFGGRREAGGQAPQEGGPLCVEVKEALSG